MLDNKIDIYDKYFNNDAEIVTMRSTFKKVLILIIVNKEKYFVKYNRIFINILQMDFKSILMEIGNNHRNF